MAKLKDYRPPEPESYERFLWWCAGADRRVLTECTYADYVKYSGLGGIVLATGLLAMLSMGFALSRVFESLAVAIPIGLLWGCIIFNLDRFVVSSTGKGDGKHTISWGEFWHALPRLFMATMIGFTISAPLEVYIFQKEIDKQWEIRKDEERASIRQKLIDHRKDEYIAFKEQENILKADVQLYKDHIARLTEMISDETTRRGCGPICRGHMQQRADLERRQKVREKEFAAVADSIHHIDQEREQLVELRAAAFSGKLGMLDSLTALHQYPGSFWPVWLLRLLFIFIEVAPVIFKLMIAYSPYDYLSENLMQIQLAKQGIEFKEGFSKVEDGSFHDKIIFHEARQLVQDEQLRRAADAALYVKLMKAYEEREGKSIDEHPEDYIKPS